MHITPEAKPTPPQVITADMLYGNLPTRKADVHKGTFGHLLVTGGNYQFGGAAIMTAQAAAHCGVGMVSLFTRPEHISAMLCRQPEIMASCTNLDSMIARANSIVAGPGLGTCAWADNIMLQILASDKPLLLDADALNYLARLPANEQQYLKRDNWILTPHPGEAARLLSVTVEQVQQQRLAAALTLQQRFGGTIMLKGHGTIVCGGANKLYILQCGNPGMAVAGMGDVLAGVTGAMLAQGMTTITAACAGSWLHSTAADKLALQQGEHGLLPTALLPVLTALLNSSVTRTKE